MRHEVWKKMISINPSRKDIDQAVTLLLRKGGIKTFGDLAQFHHTFNAFWTIARNPHKDWALLTPDKARHLAQAYFKAAIDDLWSGCNPLTLSEIMDILMGGQVYFIAKQYSDEGAHHDNNIYNVVWHSYSSPNPPIIKINGYTPLEDMETTDVLIQIGEALHNKDSRQFPFLKAFTASVRRC
ncbi:hypothetical protein SELMODRAFT_413078 [Selaginella moellendorffii]|uniref:Uncharacterized protein n=1 Tax=Selaginella moellendorffii TaxID=88036 RepID=D8RN95_SELML|nr:hypothetical protein SELMODRAFT_413078 [Selaginella moellendorffii]